MMDGKDTRFRCRTGNRTKTYQRKSSSESLPELQLVPPDGPLFHCQQCGFVNTLIPMCLWCTWSSEEAQHAFELSLPRVRHISSMTRIHWAQLDMSTSAPSPRAHNPPSFHSGRLPPDLQPSRAYTYGLPLYGAISARRDTPHSATMVIGPTCEHVDNSEAACLRPPGSQEGGGPPNRISTVGISIATSSRPSLHEGSDPVVADLERTDFDRPVDRAAIHQPSFDSFHIPEDMNSPVLTLTRKPAKRDLIRTANAQVTMSGVSDDKSALAPNDVDHSLIPTAPVTPRYQHMPTLRRKITNLNIQTSNLQAKEPIAITLNLQPSPDSVDGMDKKAFSPQLPPSATGLLTTPSDTFTPHVNRSSTLESATSESRLSSLHPQASSPNSSTGGRAATSSPVRIGHPSRPYYSAIRGPHGISPPPSRPTSTDGLPQRRARPLSLSQIVTGSTPLGGEPGTAASDSGVDNSRTRAISAGRHHQSMSISSPVSPPPSKYSAFSIPSDSDLEEEYDDEDRARAHPPTPSHGRLFFSLAARSRRRQQRVSFPAPVKRASGGVDGASATDPITALAHGHAHAAFTQSLSRASGKRYRGSSGGMGFSLSGHTELRMALAEGAAEAGIEEHAFKFRETGPPPPAVDADVVGISTAAKGRGVEPANGDPNGKGFMNRVRKLRNNLKDILLS